MSLLSLAAMLFALWRSWDRVRLRCYFGSLLLASLAGRFVAWRYGDTSTAYLWAYASLTGLILVSVVLLAWDARYWRGAAIAGVLAASVGHLASFGLLLPIKPYEAVGLAEGAILFWAALVLGGTAAYRPDCGISATLSLLWFAQALWRWEFILNLPSEDWLAANWRIPPLLCIVAFTAVALQAKAPARPLASRLR